MIVVVGVFVLVVVCWLVVLVVGLFEVDYVFGVCVVVVFDIDVVDMVYMLVWLCCDLWYVVGWLVFDFVEFFVGCVDCFVE